MILQHTKYALLSLLFIVFQSTVANFISINRVVPDLLLIFIVFIALKQGQINAMVYAFFIGLVFDLVTGGVWGLSSLSKIVAGFVAGYFYNENKTYYTLSSYKFILIILLVSIVHNFIYFVVYIQGSDMEFWKTVVLVGISTSLYTTILSLFIVFYFTRRYSFVRND